MNERKALELALEALEDWNSPLDPQPDADIIAAIKEALAQPEKNFVTIVDGPFNHRCPETPLHIKEALAQPEQDCNYCGGTGDVSGEYPGVACPECNGSGVRVQPEFIKHEVESAEDWSEWVCPNPQSYLMKCCDCGLVHEAQFNVVRYKSENEREDCDMVDDPNVQVVFRMRRSEEWTPKDTAYRPGGLAQPEQEPVACIGYWNQKTGAYYKPDQISAAHQKLIEDGILRRCYTHPQRKEPEQEPVAHFGSAYVNENGVHVTTVLGPVAIPQDAKLYTTPPQRTWVGLTEDERTAIREGAAQYHDVTGWSYAKAVQQATELKLQEKNA